MKYIHKVSGAVDTGANWICSYGKDELAERGLTARQAWAEDRGKTLIHVRKARTQVEKAEWGKWIEV